MFQLVGNDLPVVVLTYICASGLAQHGSLLRVGQYLQQ